MDSKVFEVKIDVTKADTTLRPGMTTANAIEVSSIPNVMSIPLEAVVNEAGYQYAYKKSGSRVIRQMIETGTTNDNEIIVRRGLTKDDRVLLTPPSDKVSIRTDSIAGLKPIVPSASNGDTAKNAKVPVVVPPPAGMKPTSAPMVAAPARPKN